MAAAQKHWWSHDAIPGALLMAATVVSFVLQNSPAREAFDALLHQPINVRLGPFALRMDLLHFISDGLMAVFALANAGAPLGGLGWGALVHPVAIGAALGLALGKPLGIAGGVWLGARLLKLPAPASRGALLGAAMLAGVGFTMRLFIGALAFEEGPLAAPARLGVLIGSVVSACAGLALLARVLPKQPTA